MTPLLAQRQRPDRAFERIYRRHVGDVYRYALAVMRNQPDAEDVTQTTFMNAYRAFQRGERPEKPQNWLIAIAHNVCRQRFRQSARRPTEVAFEEDAAAALVEEDDAPTGDDIRRALGHLAFNQRAALVMRELEGRSYAEIADILGLSTSAVETLIFRARRALREQLESSLTCGEAELAISKQLDGRLSRAAKTALRAHLRECPDCASFARRQRAQRAALRSLAAIPVPTSLTSLFGGGGATVGTGLAVKAAVAVTAGVAVGGAGYAGIHEAVEHHSHVTRRVSSTSDVSNGTRPHRTHRLVVAHSHAIGRARRPTTHAGHVARVPKATHRLHQRGGATRAHERRNTAHRHTNTRPHSPVRRVRTPRARGHVTHRHVTHRAVTHVPHSHRPVAPPRRVTVSPHKTVHPAGRTAGHPVQHAGAGAGNANGHGK
jgi:RNA polymerase sigma-70 factor (ECF subfamily)